MRTRLTLTTAFALLATGALPGAETPAELDDAAVFPPALFPGIAAQPSDRIFWEGLAAVYPGRVLLKKPEPAEPLHSGALKQTAIAPTLVYRRPFGVQQASRSALTDLKPTQQLILDLRYFDTQVEDMPFLADFVSSLSRPSSAEPVVAVEGNYPTAADFEVAREAPVSFGGKRPVFVLVNRRTRGPIEAMLAGLQAQEAVLLIGEATAGRTGSFESYRGNGPEAPEVFLLRGELRPGTGESLIPGGAQPAIRVAVDPADEIAAWSRHNEGAALDSLYSAELFRNDAAEADENEAVDQTLETALRVISALQVLEGSPIRQ
ncbi:MAG: hypothetical protein ACFB20_01165 [Opitutales bacterium]